MHEGLGSVFPALCKIKVGTHCKCSLWEREAKILEAHSHPLLHSKFKASLGCNRSCLKQHKTKYYGVLKCLQCEFIFVSNLSLSPPFLCVCFFLSLFFPPMDITDSIKNKILTLLWFVVHLVIEQMWKRPEVSSRLPPTSLLTASLLPPECLPPPFLRSFSP